MILLLIVRKCLHLATTASELQIFCDAVKFLTAIFFNSD